MAESSAINKSLSVLGQVVHALNRGAVSPFFGLCYVVLFFMLFLYMCLEYYLYTDYMRHFFLFSLEPNPIPEFQVDEDPPGRTRRKFGRVVDL